MPSVATHSNVKSQCCAGMNALLAGRLYSFLDRFERSNSTLHFGLLLSTLRTSAIKIEMIYHRNMIWDTPQLIKRAVINTRTESAPSKQDDHVLLSVFVRV